MKTLLDEQLSRLIAEVLRARGLDAQAVTERSELTGLSDEDVMNFAALENRAVVTNNIKDFRPIAARRLSAGMGHAGLILLPASRTRTRSAVGGVADLTATVMTAHPGGIANSEQWLDRPNPLGP